MSQSVEMEIIHGGKTVKTTTENMEHVAKQLRMEGDGFGPIRTNFDEQRIDEKLRSENKTIFKSVEMRDMAEEVIEERSLDLGPAAVGCLLIYPNISKKRASKVTKNDDILRMFSGYDYFIQVSGDLWEMLDTDTQKLLLYHQLMQVDPVYKAKEGAWKFNLRKPDFSDFYTINDKYGNEWYKTIQATVSSLHDLDPRDENEVKV